MAEFPCLPLFTDAYLGDTIHLSTLEHGAYLLLLITQWRLPACALPNNDKILARYCRMTPREWSKVKPSLEPFFNISSAVWVQKRLKDERKFVEVKRQQNISAGKVSALKRKDRHSTDVITPVPTEGSTEGQHKPNQPTPTPLTLNPKEINNKQTKLPLPIDEGGEGVKIYRDDFNKFWEVFPRQRRGNKKDAHRAWAKALMEKRATTEEIQNGVSGYAASDEVSRGYAAGAEAWLNRDGWADDHKPVRRSRQDEKPSNWDKTVNAIEIANQWLIDDEQLDAGGAGSISQRERDDIGGKLSGKPQERCGAGQDLLGQGLPCFDEEGAHGDGGERGD